MDDASQNSDKTKKKKICHWSMKQDLHYRFFLILHADILSTNKKKTQIFKEMSIFTGKDEQKNRTHHNKMIHRFIKDQQPQKEMLYKFYYESYCLRKLDQKHLKTELRLFIQQSRIDQDDKARMIRKAYKNVQQMKFPQYSIKYQQPQPHNNQIASNESLEQISSQHQQSPRQPPSQRIFFQQHSYNLFNVCDFQNELVIGDASYMNIYERQFL